LQTIQADAPDANVQEVGDSSVCVHLWAIVHNCPNSTW